jgi:Spx/MgsR family transcriptional regulator
MLTLYGIPNCDTMKKTRKWLDTHDVEYVFHDYKKLGIDEPTLREWVGKVGWETLLNRRGMMWRKVPAETRDAIDESSAIRLMLDTPSIIKRPVLVRNDDIVVGFSEEAYGDLFD